MFFIRLLKRVGFGLESHCASNRKIGKMFRVVLACLLCSCASITLADDWPMYPGKAARSGYTRETLPRELSLSWAYKPTHPPAPAWPRDERMQFDRTSHVVIADGLVCFGNSVDGKVSALDAA